MMIKSELAMCYLHSWRYHRQSSWSGHCQVVHDRFAHRPPFNAVLDYVVSFLSDVSTAMSSHVRVSILHRPPQELWYCLRKLAVCILLLTSGQEKKQHILCK